MATYEQAKAVQDKIAKTFPDHATGITGSKEKGFGVVIIIQLPHDMLDVPVTASVVGPVRAL